MEREALPLPARMLSREVRRAGESIFEAFDPIEDAVSGRSGRRMLHQCNLSQIRI